MNDEAGQHDAVKELLWYSIRQAADRVNRYNFEGSMIGNVERVYRSFGGTRTGYYHFSWYRNRWIRTAMAFLNK
jgi:hypothetical protein